MGNAAAGPALLTKKIPNAMPITVSGRSPAISPWAGSSILLLRRRLRLPAAASAHIHCAA
jgi:hypothetical protein